MNGTFFLFIYRVYYTKAAIDHNLQALYTLLMSMSFLRRRIILSSALIWELVRLGLLWSMNERLIAAIFPALNTFYIMWLIAPVLAIISGYLIVLYQPGSRNVCILLANSRGFQTVFGLLAVLTGLAGTLQFPGLIPLVLMLIADMLFLALQIWDIAR